MQQSLLETPQLERVLPYLIMMGILYQWTPLVFETDYPTQYSLSEQVT
jgi:hypothetical protein